MGTENNKKHIVIPEDLFVQIAAGNDKALEELYYISYRPLYAFLLSLTLNKEDADDLLQDTYIRIREAAHLYKPQGNPMAWIMKISKNLFLMKRRKEKGKETVALDDIYQLVEHTFSHMDQVEDRILIEQLFSQIKDDEREIIVMNVVMGMTFKEIASINDKPIGTILSKYHRAMKKLKTLSQNMEHNKKERR